MTVTWADQVEAASDMRQCMGTSDRTGERCKRRVKPPKLVCRDHGGRPSRNKKRSLNFEGADKLLKLYEPDAPAVTDPVGELQRLGGIARHARDVAGQKVNELERWDDYSAEGGRSLKVEIQLLMELMKFCERINATLAKLNIDERVTEIQAARVALIGAALEKAFSRVPLSVEQRSALDGAFAVELRAITAGHDTDAADDATLLSLVESAIQERR